MHYVEVQSYSLFSLYINPTLNWDVLYIVQLKCSVQHFSEMQHYIANQTKMSAVKCFCLKDYLSIGYHINNSSTVVDNIVKNHLHITGFLPVHLRYPRFKGYPCKLEGYFVVSLDNAPPLHPPIGTLPPPCLTTTNNHTTRITRTHTPHIKRQATYVIILQK
jgi:hypothetical protein